MEQSSSRMSLCVVVGKRGSRKTDNGVRNAHSTLKKRRSKV